MAYKHDQKEIHEACGFSKEEYTELIDKANNIARNVQERQAAISEIAEGYEKGLKLNELALLLVSTQNELAHIRMHMLSAMPQEES